MNLKLRGIILILIMIIYLSFNGVSSTIKMQDSDNGVRSIKYQRFFYSLAPVVTTNNWIEYWEIENPQTGQSFITVVIGKSDFLTGADSECHSFTRNSLDGVYTHFKEGNFIKDVDTSEELGKMTGILESQVNFVRQVSQCENTDPSAPCKFSFQYNLSDLPPNFPMENSPVSILGIKRNSPDTIPSHFEFNAKNSMQEISQLFDRQYANVSQLGITSAIDNAICFADGHIPLPEQSRVLSYSLPNFALVSAPISFQAVNEFYQNTLKTMGWASYPGGQFTSGMCSLKLAEAKNTSNTFAITLSDAVASIGRIESRLHNGETVPLLVAGAEAGEGARIESGSLPDIVQKYIDIISNEQWKYRSDLSSHPEDSKYAFLVFTRNNQMLFVMMTEANPKEVTVRVDKDDVMTCGPIFETKQ